MSKNMKKAYEGVDREAEYSVEDALKLIKKAAKSRKFDQTVDMAVNLNVDPRHADQNVRGMFQLPHGTGSSVRVAVFAKDDKAKEAKAAGADIVGAEDLADDIRAGKMDFDRCIATPDMMPLVGQLGKILGPKGLMPNPKLGTVTPDVKKAVEDAKAGSIEYRVEKSGIVHVPLGKISFDDKKLVENIRAFIAELQRVKPSGIKGAYMKKISMSSTMGPGVKLSAANCLGTEEKKAA